MLNMNFLCELTIVIPGLLCLFSMANAVSSTVVLVNWEMSDSVNLVNFDSCFCLEVFPHSASPML